MPLNFSSLLICQWPFVGFLLRTAFCPTLGCDMHPERRMGQGLLKPHFGSALTIHGAHLQFHLRCWEGHRKAAEGLFKVSPSLLWNAQWIGANSRSTPRRRPPRSVSCLAALLREEVKRDCTPTGCLAGRWRVFWNANLQSWGLETCLLFRATVTHTREK